MLRRRGRRGRAAVRTGRRNSGGRFDELPVGDAFFAVEVEACQPVRFEQLTDLVDADLQGGSDFWLGECGC